jgi:uncharacterized damage-inducible protein DinB
MKKIVFILAILLAVSAVLTAGSQNVYAQKLSKEQVIKSFKALGDYTVAVAEAMPAEQFGSKPNEEIWTFAEQLNHIAGSNYFMGSILKSPKRMELKATEKAQVVSDLKESLDYVVKALEKFDAKDFDEEMDWFGGSAKRSRFHAYLFFVDHMTHHRGCCIIYLRYKGIKPPGFASW